jgi:uncharacterized protein (UPF0332 family)
MVNLKWCLNAKNGVELVEPNDNISKSYLRMAEESLRSANQVKSRIWIGSILYYSAYYCLYSVMIKAGVKCEIHQCSIEFMKRCLLDFYNKTDVEFIEMAFEIRNDLQYYPNREINFQKFEFVRSNAPDFFVKTKDILVMITEKQINKIRGMLNG